MDSLCVPTLCTQIPILPEDLVLLSVPGHLVRPYYRVLLAALVPLAHRSLCSVLGLMYLVFPVLLEVPVTQEHRVNLLLHPYLGLPEDHHDLWYYSDYRFMRSAE